MLNDQRIESPNETLVQHQAWMLDVRRDTSLSWIHLDELSYAEVNGNCIHTRLQHIAKQIGTLIKIITWPPLSPIVVNIIPLCLSKFAILSNTSALIVLSHNDRGIRSLIMGHNSLLQGCHLCRISSESDQNWRKNNVTGTPNNMYMIIWNNRDYMGQERYEKLEWGTVKLKVPLIPHEASWGHVTQIWWTFFSFTSSFKLSEVQVQGVPLLSRTPKMRSQIHVRVLKYLQESTINHRPRIDH